MVASTVAVRRTEFFAGLPHRTTIGCADAREQGALGEWIWRGGRTGGLTKRWRGGPLQSVGRVSRRRKLQLGAIRRSLIAATKLLIAPFRQGRARRRPVAERLLLLLLRWRVLGGSAGAFIWLISRGRLPLLSLRGEETLRITTFHVALTFCYRNCRCTCAHRWTISRGVMSVAAGDKRNTRGKSWSTRFWFAV